MWRTSDLRPRIPRSDVSWKGRLRLGLGLRLGENRSSANRNLNPNPNPNPNLMVFRGFDGTFRRAERPTSKTGGPPMSRFLPLLVALLASSALAQQPAPAKPLVVHEWG